VQSVVTNLGRPEMSTETMGLYQADVDVNFKPDRQPKGDAIEALIGKMDRALKAIPGLDYDFSAPMAMRLDEAISGVRTALGVKVFGDDIAVLQQKAAEISAIVTTVPGSADVSVDVSAGAMQLELALDRPALARNGLNVGGRPSSRRDRRRRHGRHRGDRRTATISCRRAAGRGVPRHARGRRPNYC